MLCNGECAKMTSDYTTIYSCFPFGVCDNLNIANRCQTFEHGSGTIYGCCCSYHYCNSPPMTTTIVPTTTYVRTTTTTPTTGKGLQVMCLYKTILGYSTDTYSSDGQCPSNNHYQNAGTLSSPGYPSDYYNDLRCNYYLSVPIGHRVIVFFRQFRTEDCCDVVTLYDGFGTQFHVIAR